MALQKHWTMDAADVAVSHVTTDPQQKRAFMSCLLQQPQPVAVIYQPVIKDPEDFMHPEALVNSISSLSRQRGGRQHHHTL